jgi:hypothetical protein
MHTGGLKTGKKKKKKKERDQQGVEQLNDLSCEI